MRFSKDNYLQFLQCPRLLWTACNAPQALAAPDESAEARMREGQLVESHARKLFPDAHIIAHDQPFDEVVAQSQEALLRPAGRAVCNALLAADGLVAETDILVPVDDGFDLFEVKSSTNAKPEHLPDSAFQWFVAGKMGLRIRRCFLILVNGKYVRSGEMNPKHLFQVGDVTDGVLEHGATVDMEAQVNHALETCRQEKCPEIPIGEQCTDDCPLRNACWKGVDANENNIFTLYRLPSKRAFGWFRQGITSTDKIPPDFPLNERQKVQARTEKNGKLHVNGGKVRAFLNQLEFPLSLLDFETFASAIPLLDGSSPYQQIPFQFSLHVIDKNLDEEPRHESWIWNKDAEADPKREMLMRLQPLLGNEGSIIAYNAPFEQSILKQAVRRCPEHGEWLVGILGRFVDLLTPFRNFAVYHPKQHGSCSLKAVLPALTGRSYDRLEIGDGETASREFMRIVKGEATGKEVEDIRRRLEEYCGLDTMAMVEILRVMRGLSE